MDGWDQRRGEDSNGKQKHPNEALMIVDVFSYSCLVVFSFSFSTNIQKNLKQKKKKKKRGSDALLRTKKI